jgi:hypothetical protein
VIKDLNPEIRGHYIAAGNHNILIPERASEGFEERFRRLEKSFLEAQKGRIYIIKNGDNLSSIAHKFDVPIASLIIWNSIDLSRPIHPGDRLIIYPKNTKSDKTPQS